MAQSDGFGNLERIALQLNGSSSGEIAYYKFKINPQDYKESHPQRATSFKTRTATVVEDYGPDLTTITFSGTTGLGKRGDSGTDRIKGLENMLEVYSQSSYRLEDTGRERLELVFYNFTDEKSFVVHLEPEGWSIERSAERSILYDYTVNLTVLRKASDPDGYDREANQPVIGNDLKHTTTEHIKGTVNPNSNTRVYNTILDGIRPLAY